MIDVETVSGFRELAEGGVEGVTEFVGTRAGQKWLAVVKRIASALERIADQMEDAEQTNAPTRDTVG